MQFLSCDLTYDNCACDARREEKLSADIRKEGECLEVWSRGEGDDLEVCLRCDNPSFSA